jgi:hypothetical protein
VKETEIEKQLKEEQKILESIAEKKGDNVIGKAVEYTLVFTKHNVFLFFSTYGSE